MIDQMGAYYLTSFHVMTSFGFKTNCCCSLLNVLVGASIPARATTQSPPFQTPKTSSFGWQEEELLGSTIDIRREPTRNEYKEPILNPFPPASVLCNVILNTTSNIQAKEELHVSPSIFGQERQQRNSVGKIHRPGLANSFFVTSHIFDADNFEPPFPPKILSTDMNRSSSMLDFAVPDEFICPLTLQVFDDPVMTRCGHSFERTAILEWILDQGQATCPITRVPLFPSMLVPNVALRQRIQQWRRHKSMTLRRDRDLNGRQDTSQLLSCC